MDEPSVGSAADRAGAKLVHEELKVGEAVESDLRAIADESAALDSEARDGQHIQGLSMRRVTPQPTDHGDHVDHYQHPSRLAVQGEHICGAAGPRSCRPKLRHMAGLSSHLEARRPEADVSRIGVHIGRGFSPLPMVGRWWNMLLTGLVSYEVGNCGRGRQLRRSRLEDVLPHSGWRDSQGSGNMVYERERKPPQARTGSIPRGSLVDRGV